MRPVTNPQKELDADQMNLTFWQVAGAGRVLPQATIVYVGATPLLTYQALAFDPRELLGNIANAKTGVGVYTFTFASTYKDEAGNDVAFTPRAAQAMVQGAAAQVQAVPNLNGQVVQVIVMDGAGAPADATILLMVW